MNTTYSETNRIGDHIWWVGDLAGFKRDCPGWDIRFDVPAILQEIYENNVERWAA